MEIITDMHWIIAARNSLAVLVVLLVSGCTQFNPREYEPFVRDLDDSNQLEISTYAADFPDRLTEQGAVFEKYESADELYFQVNIRDSRKSAGPNTNVESILIHSFSYRFDDEPPSVLLSDYDYNFWMQGNPRYDKQDLPPIPYKPDGRVFIEIHFTLNGKTFEFEGDMPATESSSTLPTFIVNQGV